VAPAETVDVVNITTGSGDAEQGLSGGASTTVVTKSGTNDLLLVQLRQDVAASKWCADGENTPQFGVPNGSVTSTNFMVITSASGERQVRFGLRLSF
jgi:hypothetical protein